MKGKLLLLAILLFFGFNCYSQTVFGSKQVISGTTTNPYVIANGDIDGDNLLDIIVGTYTGNDIVWYKGDGTGGFTTQAQVLTLAAVGSIKLVDLDGDTDLDILASSYSTDKVVWYANNGVGIFGAEQIISSSVDGASQVNTAMIDGDSTLDVAVAVYGPDGDTDRVIWFANDGAGNFGPEQTINATVGSGPGNIAFNDFDGDGDLDALIGFTDIGTAEVYYNQLIPGGSVSWVQDTNNVTSGNGYLFVTKFADVNDDNQTDIVKSDNFGDIAWYNQEGDGSFTENIIPASLGNRPGVIAVVDLDNDTYNDVLATYGGAPGPTTNDVVWFESTDSGGLNAQTTIDMTHNQIFGITLADFDQDGDIDIATVDYQQHQVNYIENLLETLSVESFENPQIKLYPNPAKNFITISGIRETVDVSVYNVLGQNVMNAVVSPNDDLNISNLKQGIYLMKFNDKNHTFKFVKE